MHEEDSKERREGGISRGGGYLRSFAGWGGTGRLGTQEVEEGHEEAGESS